MRYGKNDRGYHSVLALPSRPSGPAFESRGPASTCAVEGDFRKLAAPYRKPGSPVITVAGGQRRVQVERPNGAVRDGYLDKAGDVVLDDRRPHETHSLAGLKGSGSHVYLDPGPQPRRGGSR